jgi:pimeloyl-ACP methyl ester carboxylesterase
MKYTFANTFLGLFALVLFTGCTTKPQVADLGGLYDRSARYHDAERNPVIVIPGILGSKLVDDASGKIVWGAFGGKGVDPESAEGAALCAIPMKEGVALEALKDDVRVDGSLDRLKITFFGLPIELSAYLNILGTLGVGGYRDQQLAEAGAINYGEDHFTCFQFAYDWRRSNAENAMLLHEFIESRRTYVQQQIRQRYGIADADVKFDIVAHSMGGLISRYYLRYGNQSLPADGSLPDLNWAGTRRVERLIMVGTPNAGSAAAIHQLVEGLSLPALAKYDAGILDTMPAIYELLPRPRHGAIVTAGDPAEKIDYYDPAVWEALQWGMASPRREKILGYLLPDEPDPARRRAIALDHQRKCLERAKQFHAALDVPAKPPEGIDLYLVAGDAMQTTAHITVDKETGGFIDEVSAPGDGTVIRTSALMDERMNRDWYHELVTPIAWRDVTFLYSNHLGMTKDPVFADKVLYLLLEDPRGMVGSSAP